MIGYEWDARNESSCQCHALDRFGHGWGMCDLVMLRQWHNNGAVVQGWWG